MNIGIDVTSLLYEGTGVGEYTRHLVAELLRQNPQDEFVLFFSTLRGFKGMKEKIAGMIKENQDNKGNRVSKNYKIVGVPLPPSFWQFVWNRLNYLKIEWLIGRVDVFHCWDYLIPPSNCEKIITVHDVTPLLFPETHTQKIIINYKLLIAKIKNEKINVIAVSENSKKDLVKIGIDQDLISVIFNGNNFQTKNNEIKYEKENYILAVGTREPRKNLSSVIKAFTGIAEKYPKLKLIMAGKYGWGENNELTSRPASPAGRRIDEYKERIKILGFVSDEKLVELYRHAICLVYPSLYEGFGFPVLEAMSLGCPVITSNVSSLPEVGGDAVLYIEPKNSSQIAQEMIRIIESEELRNDLIKKGLEQAKKFSWEKCAKETKKIYEKLAVSI